MDERFEKRKNLIAFLSFFSWLFLGASILAVPMLMVAPVILGIPAEEYLSNTKLITEHTYIPAVIANTAAVIVYVIMFKNVIKNDGNNFKTSWWKFLILIVVGFLLLLLSNFIMTIVYEKLGLGDQTSQNQQGIIDALNGSTKPFVIIYTVILAPIFEEIVFRKLFYTTFRQYTKLPAWAIVLIISAIFAFIHVTDFESLVFFPQYFVLALIITGAYAISKENLLVSIGLHFLNNLLAILEILI